MTDLLDLAELESDDPELVPEIVAVDARMSIRGKVATFIELFERAVSVAPTKEIIVGSSYTLLEAVPTSAESIAHARVTATDGIQTLSVVADGPRVFMPGAVLLPGARVLKILKECPTDTVRIEVVGSQAHIRSGRAQWTVKTPLSETLPPKPNVDDIELHVVPTQPFLEALIIAHRAIPTYGRPALMQVEIHEGAVTAQDGGKLHRKTIEGFPPQITMTVPFRVVEELVKALKATESENVEVGANNYHLVFRIDNDSLIANRLLMSFPDVEALIMSPAFTNQHRLTVDKVELLEVIHRVRVNANPDHAAIYLSLIPAGRDSDRVMAFNLAVRAQDTMGNSAQEIMECAWFGPETGRELCVNHKNLTEFLLSQAGDSVTFKVGDDTKTQKYPLFIENRESGFTGFIVQMRPEYVR